MDIILYLTELLQTRKAVGIVGLGTLYKKKIPGKYDANQHAFVPPSFVLAFSPDLKEDEELAEYITFKRNISKESADYYISEFAEKIQAQLADHQKADLAPLGMLSFVNGELILEADNESIFGYESYGLPKVAEIDNGIPIPQLPDVVETTEPTLPVTQENEHPVEIQVDPIVAEEKLAAIEEENKLEEENPGQATADDSTTNDEPVYDEISENTYQTTWELKHNHPPVIETVETTVVSEPDTVVKKVETPYFEEETTKKGMPFFMKFLIIFLVIVAIGAIAYFINPAFFDKYIQQNHQSKPITNLPVTTADSVTAKSDSGATDSLAKNNAMVTLAKDTTAIDSSDKIAYEVLISAENTEAKADLRISRLAKRGIIAKKVRLSKALINISAGSFLDLAAATKRRDSLRIIFKNPEIYIKSINPKNKK